MPPTVLTICMLTASHAFAAGGAKPYDPTKATARPPREYGQFGPFDYYDTKNTPRNALPLVESGHFGSKTFELARLGDWCFYWGDLDYTLRAFPNHPRALVAMAEYLETRQACETKRSSSSSPEDLAAEIEKGLWREHNADFYFQKAIEFRPQYAATHVLYGKYLRKAGRRDDALEQFADAEKLEPQSADAQYYLGLIYLDKGDNAKAKQHAERAYRLGQQQTELKERLVKAGLWGGK